MRRRSIAGMIILTVITCGIYYFIAFVQVFSDINYESREGDSAITDLVLTIITCGLWSIYCFYKYSKKLAYLGTEDNTLINVLLAIFGLPIISLCIMQSTMNYMIDRGRTY